MTRTVRRRSPRIVLVTKIVIVVLYTPFSRVKTLRTINYQFDHGNHTTLRRIKTWDNSLEYNFRSPLRDAFNFLIKILQNRHTASFISLHNE
jgi:hypothetical protein